MTKSEEEGLLTIVTTFVSEIYFSMWFLESSCVDDSEYVPNLPAAMYIFFTTSVQSENLTFLGVRSTNPLPAASGLVKLTTLLVLTLLPRWCQSPQPATSLCLTGATVTGTLWGKLAFQHWLLNAHYCVACNEYETGHDSDKDDDNGKCLNVFGFLPEW